MIHIDPTYLRTIHDGLLSGTLHKDNASALPAGLVGIYEESLPPASHVKERQKFLEFFSAWSLLKKEVSTSFLSQLLAWPEEEILDYISHYSKWFNAPTSGKYVLYHERLRSFVLQKISHKQLIACNEKIIKLGQEALEKRSGDEWEHYALEYLSAHLLIRAMESKDADLLKTLAYSNEHWNRQVEISKGFEWSKRMLNDMMLWASKYDDDEVIECALNKVDLYHREQNDAPRIVELVAQNDMDTALQRIEAFGGNDEEGLQRKFILYMLCLMELTLLDSKDKPFRKEAIEKLLKHLDDNLPVDLSVLNGNDFFPSYLMFLLISEWGDLKIDYAPVLRHIENPELNWIDNFDQITHGQSMLLDSMIRLTCSGLTIINNFIKISAKLFSSGYEERADLLMNQSIEYLSELADDSDYCLAAVSIALGLLEGNHSLRVSEITELSFKRVVNISYDYYRNEVYKGLSIVFAKMGNIEKMQLCINAITDDNVKNNAIIQICEFLADNEDWEIALEMAESITDNYKKGLAHGKIAVLAARLKFEEIAEMLYEKISSNYRKCCVLADWFVIYQEAGNDKKASGFLSEAKLKLADIPGLFARCSIMVDILDIELNYLKLPLGSTVFYSLQEITEYIEDLSDRMSIYTAMGKLLKGEDSSTFQKGIADKAENNIQSIHDNYQKNSALKLFGLYACEIDDEKRVEGVLKSISDVGVRNTYILECVIMQLGKARFYDIKQFLITALEYNSTPSAEAEMISVLEDVVKESLEINVIINIIDVIENDAVKTGLILRILNEPKLTETQKLSILEKAELCASDMEDNLDKEEFIMQISTHYAAMGKHEKAAAFIEIITYEDYKSAIFKSIALAHVNADLISEATLLLDSIEEARPRFLVMSAIAKKLAFKGGIQTALQMADNITVANLKADTIAGIAEMYVNRGELAQALLLIDHVSAVYRKCQILNHVAMCLFRGGNPTDAEAVIKQSLALASELKNGFVKSSALQEIAAALRVLGLSNLYSEILKNVADIIEELEDESDKSWGLAAQVTEYVKNNQLTEAVASAAKVKDSHLKSNSLAVIVQYLLDTFTLSAILKIINDFQDREIREGCIRALINAIRPAYFKKESASGIVFCCKDDLRALEKLLMNYSFSQLFFKDNSSGYMPRISGTLNIQWAIDIKNSVNANQF